MALMDDIPSAATVMVDTAPFVYFIERHATYLSIVKPVFSAMDTGTISGVTSAMTLLETLVYPYRNRNATLAARYEAFLTKSRGLKFEEITRHTCRTAAQLRAVHRVGTPDAIQLATALLCGATIFLTNDRALPNIPGLRILQVAQYAP